MAPALPAAAQELEASSDGLPCSTIKAGLTCDIPVIDLQGVDGERRPLVLQQIQRACEDWGIFQAINHGIPASLPTRMLKLAKEFFDLPIEEKRKLSSPRDTPQPGLLQGYSSKDYGRSVLDWGDQMRHITSPASARDYKLWPTNPPSYRETKEEYIAEQEKFAKRMLDLISESLGLQTTALSDVFAEKYQRSVVINHYPPCPNPNLTVGLHEHSDFSILTILLQDAAGLEVLTREGEWRLVAPIREAMVVNLGDQMQVLSNGQYQSPVHRATVSGDTRRVSVVAFTNPADETVVAPMAALVSEARPALYAGRTFGAYKAAFNAQKDRDKNKNVLLRSSP